MMEQVADRGKSAGEKAADKRVAESRKKWGTSAAAIFAVTALLHLIVFRTDLSWKGYLTLILQGATYAACTYYISNASREEVTGHGSALHKGGAPVNPMADASMWQDAFYINAGAQLLSLVTDWGWLLWLAVPGVLGYYVAKGGYGMLQQVKKMAQANGLAPPEDDGADRGAGGKSKSQEKRERKQEMIAKRAKGVSLKAPPPK